MKNARIKVTVLYFAAFRDIFKTSRQTVSVPEGTTLASLQKLLFKDHVKALALIPSMAAAVNQEFAKPSQVLKDGDEVAFLPPVSGG